MTTENSPQGTQSDELLRKARANYADISAAIRDALEKLKDSDSKDIRAFSTTLQAYWKSLQTVIDREVDLEKCNRERAGIVHGYALDLAAARTEVGGRLARLTDAGSDSDVS